MDITEIILADHEEQRRLFARIDEVDQSDTQTLQVLWNRLSAMLEVHAEAEEVYFYPALLKLGERLKDSTEAEETIDAIGDHNEIRDGIRATSLHDVGSNGWWQGVMAARKANDEHMGEEEHEGLRDFRRHIDLETRHKIAVAFIAYEAEHFTGVPIVDKDPKKYVEDNE